MQFKNGDVVCLKSGGHKMTIREVSDEWITCVWSDGKQSKVDSFREHELRSGDPPHMTIEFVDQEANELIDKLSSALSKADTHGQKINKDLLQRAFDYLDSHGTNKPTFPV